MPRILTMPANRAMRHKPDVWELAIEIGQKKGLSPQQVVAAVFRSHALQWAGLDVPQPHPAITPAATSEPFDASKAIDSLINSL